MLVALNAIPLTDGGGLTGLVGYVRALRNLGVAMVAFASRTRTIEQLEGLGVEVVPAAEGKSLPWRTWWQLREMPRELVRRRCDLLMMTNSSIPRCPVPQIVHHRNLWAFESPGKEVPQDGSWLKLQAIRMAARAALKRSAANVFVSHYLRQAAERIVPQSASRNHVINNGLDELVLRGRNDATSFSKEPLICAAQHANPQKDNQTLIEALSHLARLAPVVQWKLVIAGGGDWSRWKRLAASLGVLERIEWAGHLETRRLIDLYDRSLCLMFPSYFESFGNPPLEAMARGCPVIAVNSTAMPEVIGEAGILLAKGDSLGFANAALSLWREPLLKQRLVDIGLRRAEGFKWKTNAERLLELMERVVRHPNGTLARA